MPTIEGKFKVTTWGLASYAALEGVFLSLGASAACLAVWQFPLEAVGYVSGTLVLVTTMLYKWLDHQDRKNGGALE